jgi:hypothetical protein
MSNRFGGIMNTFIRSFCVGLVALVAQHAFAQATRTWASGAGDDANPCSRTAPCKTFAGAISKTAARGEIDALDPGGFGAVTITKSITIEGGATLAGILNAGTNGIIVNAATTDDVVLRNLTINGAGTGLAAVRIFSARSVTLENVTILGQTGSGVDINTTAEIAIAMRNVTIRATAPTVIANTAGVSLVNGNNTSTNPINAVLENVQVLGYPLGLELGALASANVDRSNFAFGGIGVKTSAATATVRLSDSTVTGNTTGLSTPFGSIVSYNNNRLRGNTTDGAPTSAVYTR